MVYHRFSLIFSHGDLMVVSGQPTALIALYVGNLALIALYVGNLQPS